MGNLQAEDPQRGDVRWRICSSEGSDNDPSNYSILIEKTGNIMNYVIGLLAGAVIGGAIGYLGKCAGST